MNLEDQVCTLEQAKRLEELGINEDSHFFFCACCDCIWTFDEYQQRSICITGKWINTYTSAELGEIISKNLPFNWTQHTNNESIGEFAFTYGVFLLEESDLLIASSSVEAHARAEFLIYLLENRDE